MAEGDFVEPLSGEEIVIDLCSLLAERLRKDCNLRQSDSYAGGYSAKVTVRVECYGMDAAVVEAEVSMGTAKTPDPEQDYVTYTELDVPVEAALDQVRERSDQPVPTLSTEGGEPVVRPRRYVRRERMVGAATGESI